MPSVRSRLVATAIATLAGVAALGALAPAGVAAASPVIVEGTRDTVTLQQTKAGTGRIATLALGPGRWVAWATLTARLGESSATVRCQLGASGSSLSASQVARVSRTTDVLVEGSFNTDLDLSTVAVLGRGGGAITLDCTSSRTDTKADRIRIVAMRASSIDSVSTDDLPAPIVWDDTDIVHVRAPGTDALPNDAWTTVAAFSLPRGPWWIHGSLTARGKSIGTVGELSCRLLFDGQRSASVSFMVGGGWSSQAFDVAGVAGRRAPSSPVTLQCRPAFDSTGTLRVSDIRLVAMNAGRLRAIDPVTDEAAVTGATDPTVAHVGRPEDSTVAPFSVARATRVVDVPVPAGTWLVKTAFWSTAIKDDDGAYGIVPVTCRLGSGPGRDVDTRLMSGDPMPVSMMATFTSTGSRLVLSCSRPGSTTGIQEIPNLHLTLVKVDEVTTRPLD